jgi:hypothetical protein
VPSDLNSCLISAFGSLVKIVHRIYDQQSLMSSFSSGFVRLPSKLSPFLSSTPHERFGALSISVVSAASRLRASPPPIRPLVMPPILLLLAQGMLPISIPKNPSLSTPMSPPPAAALPVSVWLCGSDNVRLAQTMFGQESRVEKAPRNYFN